MLRTLITKTAKRCNITATTTTRSFSSSHTFDLSGKFEVHNLPFEEGTTEVPCESPEISATTDREELMHCLREMMTIRRMELTCDKLYKDKFIRGFCHLYDGQEAIATGMMAALTNEDALIGTYRCHGHQLVRGDTVEAILAEMFGFSQGSSKGKGGSMHLYRKDTNFFGGAGIVGAQVPLGAGLAFAAKYNAKEGELMNVGVMMYGDGAANQGQNWEAANMSKLWGLPTIFVCENNQYGMGTSIERSSAITDYYEQGGVAIPGIKCDGMDYLAVRECFKYCKEYSGSGNGPIYVELNTYRYHGHSMSDPGTTYRNRDEIGAVRESRDPIETVKNYLIEAGWSDEKELKQLQKAVTKEVNEAAERAKQGTLPEMQELHTDIYDDGTGKSEIPKFVRMPVYEHSVGV